MGCYVESRKSSPGAVNLNPKKVIIASQNMLLFGLSGTAQGMQLTELVVLTTFFCRSTQLKLGKKEQQRSRECYTHSFSIAFFLPFVSQAPLFAVYISIIINQQRAVFGLSDFFFLSFILMGLNTNYQVTCHVLLTALFQLHRVTYHFQRAHLELMFSIQALEISNQLIYGCFLTVIS